MAVILSYVEINRFKREKISQYYSLIKKIASSEIELNQLIEKYWKSILDHKKLKSN